MTEKGRFICNINLEKSKKTAQAYYFLKGLGNLRTDIVVDMVLRTLGDDINEDMEHMSRGELMALYNKNVYLKGAYGSAPRDASAPDQREGAAAMSVRVPEEQVQNRAAGGHIGDSGATTEPGDQMVTESRNTAAESKQAGYQARDVSLHEGAGDAASLTSEGKSAKAGILNVPADGQAAETLNSDEEQATAQEDNTDSLLADLISNSFSDD